MMNSKTITLWKQFILYVNTINCAAITVESLKINRFWPHQIIYDQIWFAQVFDWNFYEVDLVCNPCIFGFPCDDSILRSQTNNFTLCQAQDFWFW